MKTMKTTNKMIIAVTAGMLLAGWAGAEDPAPVLSAATALDTRSISAVVTDQDHDLETRSYTIDWSQERTLNTKAIKGTMILIR